MAVHIAQDNQEIRRIAQMLDEPANLGHSQHIPCASQGEFEDDQGTGHPVSNDGAARGERGTSDGSHGVDLPIFAHPSGEQVVDKQEIA